MTLLNGDGDTSPAWRLRRGDTYPDQCKWPTSNRLETGSPGNAVPTEAQVDTMLGLNQIAAKINELAGAQVVAYLPEGSRMTVARATAWRDAIQAVRADYGLSAYAFTRAPWSDAPLSYRDLFELRDSVNFPALGLYAVVRIQAIPTTGGKFVSYSIWNLRSNALAHHWQNPSPSSADVPEWDTWSSTATDITEGTSVTYSAYQFSDEYSSGYGKIMSYGGFSGSGTLYYWLNASTYEAANYVKAVSQIRGHDMSGLVSSFDYPRSYLNGWAPYTFNARKYFLHLALMENSHLSPSVTRQAFAHASLHDYTDEESFNPFEAPESSDYDALAAHLSSVYAAYAPTTYNADQLLCTVWTRKGS